MCNSGFNAQDVNKLRLWLETSRKIVITCHLSPDGDALGSSLGLKRLVTNLNPEAHVEVVTPDHPTKTLSFLPGYKEILPYSQFQHRVTHLVEEADLLICLDFNQLSRTDLLADCLRESNARKVLIDHHIDPEHFADIMFSFPLKCATCMLLFQIIVAAGLEGFISADVAECLLAGMMTDTGDFSYNVSDPETYNVIGRLIGLGADKARLTRLLFKTFSESCLRIHGYALSQKMEVFYDYNAALIVLTRDELNHYDYHKGDTEGLVNRPLEIPGIIYSCFLREETNYIKVSMRSLGDFPVNKICEENFNGGGHLNAAGGEFYGTMEECITTFKKILPGNSERFIEGNHAIKKIIKESKASEQH